MRTIIIEYKDESTPTRLRRVTDVYAANGGSSLVVLTVEGAIYKFNTACPDFRSYRISGEYNNGEE